MRHLPRAVLALAATALLAACGGGGAQMRSAATASRAPGIECAPFARELSGIALYGDAASWWEGAEGRYRKASLPGLGGVLVFRRSSRLPYGHVSVVSRLVGPRQIEVIQANWVPGELDEDQLVVDVSAANDWSVVRVWYPPANQLGAHEYPSFGFVLPPRPATREELAQATRPAVRLAATARGRAAPQARSIGF